MTRFTPKPITSGFLSTEGLNDNFDALEIALIDTVSRKNDSPNAMEGTFDMNSQAAINFRAAQTASEPVTKAQLDAASTLSTIDADTSTYTHVAAGATSQTIAARLNQWVLPRDFGAIGDGVANDTIAFQSAVTYANTNNMSVYVSEGTYLLNANITNIHDVYLAGDGRLKFGTSTYYVTPRFDETNVIYVDNAAGSDTNMGLDSTNALKTISKAMDIVKQIAKVGLAKWQLKLAAGTYPANNVIIPDRNSFVEQFQIIGSTAASVPDAILDNAVATALTNNGTYLYMQDIKVQNYTTDAIVLNPGSRTVMKNCLITSNTLTGIDMENAYLSLESTDATLANGVSVDNNSTCIAMRHDSFLNLSYATIDTASTLGVLIRTNSSVTASNCSFNNNVLAVSLKTGGSFRDFTGNTFTLNTADYGYTSYGVAERVKDYYSTLVPALDSATFSHTGDTLETTLKDDFYTVPADTLIKADGTTSQRLKITIYGAITGTLGSKTLNVKLGSAPTLIASVAIPAAVAGAFVLTLHIMSKGPTSQQTFAHTNAGVFTSNDIEITKLTTAVDMTVANALDITGTLGNAADSIAVDHWEVEEVLR